MIYEGHETVTKRRADEVEHKPKGSLKMAPKCKKNGFVTFFLRENNKKLIYFNATIMELPVHIQNWI